MLICLHSLLPPHTQDASVPSGPALLDLIDQACRGSDALPGTLARNKDFEFLRDEA